MGRSNRKQLEQIPGVGERIASALCDIGIRNVEQLKGGNPEELYRKLCDFRAEPVDRCMLYVLRCAVYYASNAEHDPDLLKWWNWKNRE